MVVVIERVVERAPPCVRETDFELDKLGVDDEEREPDHEALRVRVQRISDALVVVDTTLFTIAAATCSLQRLHNNTQRDELTLTGLHV